MQQIWAIVGLTWKAAFRYRLFWVLVFLLLAAVIALPVLIKDDGTAEGLAQIVIAYTLGAVTTILGACTLWLACGVLARDIEDCQMQVLAVKPIARWRIWLGKWLGILTLDATLLAISGLCIYGLVQWRALKLPQDERVRLRNQVLVARASVKEEGMDKLIDGETERIFRERVQKTGLKGVDPQKAREQVRQEVITGFELVPPGDVRPWIIHLGAARDLLKGQPLFLRVKFNTAKYTGAPTLYAQWQIGRGQNVRPWMSDIMSLAPDTFHEFQIPPDLFDEKGDLAILFRNPNDDTVLFPLDDGMEVLYRQGGFGANFARGLGIILCWMMLLSTLGMTCASFLSFPVAAFASIAVLVIVLSSGTLADAVQQGTIVGVDEETGQIGHSMADMIVMPIIRGMLEVIDLALNFSPVDLLSTGRVLPWTELGMAFAQIVLLMCGLLGAFGIFLFSRRELATAQGTH
jgi:hypothetical protein